MSALSGTPAMNSIAAAARATANGAEPDFNGIYTTGRKIGKITAPVPLTAVGSVLKAGARGAFDFTRFILNMIKALFQRIARAFGVDVKMSDSDLGGEKTPEAAHFSGDDPAKVNEAATAAGEAMNTVKEKLDNLINMGPDEAQLQGQGAQAYASLALEQLGRYLRSWQDLEANASQELDVHADGIARALGVPTASVRAMIEQAAGGNPAYLSGQVPPAKEEMQKAVAAYAAVQQARKDRQRVSASFCEHAAAILSACGNTGTVANTVERRLAEFADDSMRVEVIANLSAADAIDAAPEHEKVASKLGSSGVDSAKINGADRMAGQAAVAKEEVASPRVVSLVQSGKSRLARFRSDEEEDPGRPGGSSQRGGG